jgi:F-type H+-transporting ATPase subunit delta
MIPSTTARRYAEAAFAVAQKDGNPEVWLRDLESMQQSLQDPQVAEYFRDPAIAQEDKLRTLERLSSSMSPHVLNLLRVLVTRHRLHLLPAVAREFAELQRQAMGIVEAEVTVARPVSEDEKRRISERLQQATGKRVDVEIRVDPSILGGIIVQVGDRLVDASVAGRLQRLRQEMAV